MLHPESLKEVCQYTLFRRACLSVHLLPQVSTLLCVAMDATCLSRVAGWQRQSRPDASRLRLQMRAASTKAATFHGSMGVIYTGSLQWQQLPLEYHHTLMLWSLGIFFLTYTSNDCESKNNYSNQRSFLSVILLGNSWTMRPIKKMLVFFFF